MCIAYSAVVLAKNDAAIIEKCIKALLQVTDDIIVVLDDRSEDKTNEILQRLGVQVFRKKWEGYSINKNFGVQMTKNNWILCLDSDEVMNQEIITHLKSLEADDAIAYEMNIRTWFGDVAVKHCGWFPDWNIRLFNKQKMRWNDNFVHETLISDVPMTKKRIPGILDHFSFVDEAHMVKKFDSYAQLRANEWVKSQKNPSLIKQFFGPAFRFFKTFFIKRGFLDGKTGYIIAKNEYILKKKELQYWKSLRS